MQEQRNMTDLQAFLEDGLRSELLLQQLLQAMKDAQQQQLQDAERRQREGLEKRIHQDSMLSAGIDRRSSADGQLQDAERRQREGLEKRIHQDSMLSAGIDRRSSADGQLDEFLSSQARGPGISSSMSDLTSGKRYTSKTSQQVRQSGRSVTSSSSGAKTAPRRVSPGLRHQKSTETERPSKEEEEEAECQRKFRAVPVPIHVVLPLYNEMMKMRENERKEGREQRRDFLLSTQKPFSFLERDEKKREKQMQLRSTVAQSQKAKATVRKPIPKAIKDPAVSEHLKEEELLRKIRIQQRAQEILRKSTAPIENQTHTETPESRTAQRTQKELLTFLDQKPTFQPKTSSQVPDFDRLHKAFQREALRRAEKTDMTKCQPFQLRTSAMTSRPSRSISDKQHEPTVFLKRSNSFGGLTSLSTDTLPTYITDAARKRCTAIRMSVLQRENAERERVEFMRKHRMRSQAMKNTVAVRAKATDPHSSLKEVYHVKLEKHREDDRQRMKEYKKELQDIKTRVTVRPFLFEQVSQKKAKADAERRYGDKLRKAGLNEQFVKTKGEELLSAHVLKSDGDCDNKSVESDSETRHGNVDVGETIKEVEEDSVKTGVEDI